MDKPNYSIEHRKGQHLLTEERHEIEIRLKDGWSLYQIAHKLKRPYNTIKNEVRRGRVLLYGGRVSRYKAKVGETRYRENHAASRKQYKRLTADRFCNYVEQHFTEDQWSLDACYGRALSSGAFERKEMVCTKTLYNYVDKGLLRIKNRDLPEKLRRNTKGRRVRKNRRILGDSIDIRPKSVEWREEFGHWEIDTVVGSKKEKEPCVLTITERKTRNSIWVKAHNHTADAILSALREVIAGFGERANLVFRSITGDNGSEFTRLPEITQQGMAVYFTHPYSSWEKGTNECHNKLLRRFIPKGKSMTSYLSEDIAYMADWVNSLPRKVLGYRTPEELFEAELDRIYAR